MYCYARQIKNIYEEAKKNNTSFAIMLLDLDRFKYINDALGFENGDKLIIEIANKLKSFVGEKDSFIAVMEIILLLWFLT